MKTPIALAAGATAFLLIATANSGGYRYGISDQAFYIPAIAYAADPSLFPRDAALLAPQMKMWAGDELLAIAVRGLGVDLPALFVVLYGACLLLLFSAGVFVARGLSASWWAVAAATALLTIRHRIAKTGANSLEGYMHPRMIAFALGLVAIGFILRRRLLAALAFVAAAAVVHPTTALWFGAVALFAFAARVNLKPRIAIIAAAGLVIAGYLLMTPGADATWLMDVEWLAVLGEKDYLFSHEWPAYAWVTNLLYPVVILLLYRRRSALGIAARGEGTVVAGLLSLVAGFAVTVPLAAIHIAPIVQLQANRVFWVLDAVAIVYLAWWLVDDVGRRRRWQIAIAGVLVVLACGRGAYIMTDTGRPILSVNLAADDWTDAMRWLRSQPANWHVLADPGHAWKYGTSVRAAALRDTVIEQSKDSAMAMYDRHVAMRVAERARAMAGFDGFTAGQFLELGRRYDANVVVIENTRPLSLPRLYGNARFAIYSLR